MTRPDGWGLASAPDRTEAVEPPAPAPPGWTWTWVHYPGTGTYKVYAVRYDMWGVSTTYTYEVEIPPDPDNRRRFAEAVTMDLESCGRTMDAHGQLRP